MTAVASLGWVSAHCLDLTVLEVRFSTQEIIRDLQRLLDESSGHDGAEYKLWNLRVER